MRAASSTPSTAPPATALAEPRARGSRAARRAARHPRASAPLEECGDGLGQRDRAGCASVLGSAFRSVRHLVANHARHEPRQRRLVDLVQQRQRHRQRQAVERVAGREPVLERQRAPATCSVSGNSASVTAGAAWRISASRVRKSRRGSRALGVAAPSLERRTRVDVGRECARRRTRRSPRRRRARPARRALCSSSAISAISARLCARNGAVGRELAGDQRLADEHLARRAGSMRAERRPGGARPASGRRAARARSRRLRRAPRPSAARSSRASRGRRRPPRSIRARRAPAQRAKSRVVSVSSAASTHFGAFFASPDPGCRKKRMPRAPWYCSPSRGSDFTPMLPSSPASSARWIVA